MTSTKRIISILIVFSIVCSYFFVSSIFAGSGGAVDDFASCVESSVLINVLSNDDKSLTRIGSISTPQHGVAVEKNGQIRYTPNTGFSGTDTFTYTSMGTGLFCPDTAHYYEFVPSTGINWTNARTAASARNFYGLEGYLATITSAEENTFAASKLNATGWIGASDNPAVTGGTANNWYWVTGPDAGTRFFYGLYRSSGWISGPTYYGYSNWASGEPNSGGWSGGDESYANLLHGEPPFIDGTWNDLSNNLILGYVVEYGGMPNDAQTLPTATVTVKVVNSVVPINFLLKSSYTRRITSIENLQLQILEQIPTGCKDGGVTSSTCNLPDKIKLLWAEAEMHMEKAKNSSNLAKSLSELKMAKDLYVQILIILGS